jgi:hypothetical protein
LRTRRKTQHSARSFKMPRCLALGSQFIAMPARYKFFSLLPTQSGPSALCTKR